MATILNTSLPFPSW